MPLFFRNLEKIYFKALTREQKIYWEAPQYLIWQYLVKIEYYSSYALIVISYNVLQGYSSLRVLLPLRRCEVSSKRDSLIEEVVQLNPKQTLLVTNLLWESLMLKELKVLLSFPGNKGEQILKEDKPLFMHME